MDIARPPRPRPPVPLIVAGAAVGLLLTILGMSRLPPAAPEVEASTLWIDTVRQGPMTREAHGTGTLVPESQRIVSALTAGRVDKVLARPGARVDPGTVLVELSNPDVQLSALDAERQLKLAEADLVSLRSTLENAALAQEASLA